jgi:Type-1V conjugative transfer system mating pair stabilisation
MKRLLYLLFIIQFVLANNFALAGNRFNSSYSCIDSGKHCVSSGMRKVDGFEVHRDCWEYSYQKTCNYPSKDNCKNYSHCYPVADRECLLRDSLGNCVNLNREFSCKSWEHKTQEDKEARVDLVEKDGQEGLVCNGVPCIDGNCVDKSYSTNGEMMDSVSKLYAASNMKPDGDCNFNLFAGFASHCSKKAVGYSNCCPNTAKGWGRQLGAGCTKDENSLMKLRSKNLCVYVGKENKGMMKTVVKHHFCCFGNMLEKVVQVEGRKQLGINFGNGGRPNCRGLTIDEIQRLDFSKMDFSEFINELMVKFTGKYKAPNPEELASNIEAHMNIRKFDDNENNPDNKFTGLNANFKDDSWEAAEEKRLEAERKRLAAEKAEQEKQQRKIAKEKELSLAKQEYARLVNEYDRFMKPYEYAPNCYWGVGSPLGPKGKAKETYEKISDAMRQASSAMYIIEQDLKRGNY